MHERQSPMLFVEADVLFGWHHETAAGAEAARDTQGTLCVSPSRANHERGPTLGLESSDWHSASQPRSGCLEAWGHREDLASKRDVGSFRPCLALIAGHADAAPSAWPRPRCGCAQNARGEGLPTGRQNVRSRTSSRLSCWWQVGVPDSRSHSPSAA